MTGLGELDQKVQREWDAQLRRGGSVDVGDIAPSGSALPVLDKTSPTKPQIGLLSLGKKRKDKDESKRLEAIMVPDRMAPFFPQSELSQIPPRARVEHKVTESARIHIYF